MAIPFNNQLKRRVIQRQRYSFFTNTQNHLFLLYSIKYMVTKMSELYSICSVKKQATYEIHRKWLTFRVIPPRLERGTCCLEGSCSIQLSYGTSWSG